MILDRNDGEKFFRLMLFFYRSREKLFTIQFLLAATYILELECAKDSMLSFKRLKKKMV